MGLKLIIKIREIDYVVALVYFEQVLRGLESSLLVTLGLAYDSLGVFNRRIQRKVMNYIIK